jgi:hypothetical protein
VQIAGSKTLLSCTFSNSVERFSREQVLVAGDQIAGRQVFLQMRLELIGLYFPAVRINGYATGSYRGTESAESMVK